MKCTSELYCEIKTMQIMSVRFSMAQLQCATGSEKQPLNTPWPYVIIILPPISMTMMDHSHLQTGTKLSVRSILITCYPYLHIYTYYVIQGGSEARSQICGTYILLRFSFILILQHCHSILARHS